MRALSALLLPPLLGVCAVLGVRVSAGAGATAFLFIDHVTWVGAPDGPSLHVFPTPAGRDAPADQQAAEWAEVLRLAPSADTPGMRAQFDCHQSFAKDKESWNLEPWRPVVGPFEMMGARCNPGGQEGPRTERDPRRVIRVAAVGAVGYDGHERERAVGEAADGGKGEPYDLLAEEDDIAGCGPAQRGAGGPHEAEAFLLFLMGRLRETVNQARPRSQLLGLCAKPARADVSSLMGSLNTRQLITKITARSFALDGEGTVHDFVCRIDCDRGASRVISGRVRLAPEGWRLT